MTEADQEFVQFVRTETRSLQGTAWLITGDRDEAADLVQGGAAAHLQALAARSSG